MGATIDLEAKWPETFKSVRVMAPDERARALKRYTNGTGLTTWVAVSDVGWTRGRAVKR